MNIYIYKNDQQLGPFDDAQISEALTSGEFSLEDFAWKEGLTEWVRLEDLLQKPQETPPIPMISTIQNPSRVRSNVNQGVVIGGWVCCAIGLAAMYFSIWNFFIYGPLLSVAFILSVIAIVQKRSSVGILLVLVTIIIPSLIGGIHILNNTKQQVATVVDFEKTQPTQPESIAKQVTEPVLQEIKGEVFISTEGGDTKKLSGILIRFYQRENLEKFFTECTKNSDLAMPPYDQEITKAENEILSYEKQLKEVKVSEYGSQTGAIIADIQRLITLSNKLKAINEHYKASWPHASYYFSLLPQTEFETRTDSDGKFSITLPQENWIIVAETSRKFGKSEEFYYWTCMAKKNAVNVLSNFNLVTAKSSESILKTELGKAQ